MKRRVNFSSVKTVTSLRYINFIYQVFETQWHNNSRNLIYLYVVNSKKYKIKNKRFGHSDGVINEFHNISVAVNRQKQLKQRNQDASRFSLFCIALCFKR